jgi:hypothetical protein
MPQPDLLYRPTSYWDHADPVAAIVGGIRGQNRREMARDFLSGGAPGWLGEIDAGLLEDVLDEPTRDALGASHPSWMGGEYLPGCLPGEVEIARIVLASVLQDVISIRARRRRGGRRILYRVVDEYAEPGRTGWTCHPASSVLPLPMARLIELIDGAKNPDMDFGDLPLTEAIREFQEGEDPRMQLHFVAVESEFYPGLAEHYQLRGEAWVARKLRELGDEEGDEGDTEGDEDA